MAVAVERRYTPEEYLARERQATYRSEYVNGWIVAMSGASRVHNLIAGNVFGEVRTQFKGRPCEVYTADMRVRVGDRKRYTYPDVVAVCGSPQFDDTHLDTLLNPIVIVEVLSPSAEADDRGAKFADYRRLDSLQEYILIAQDRIWIEQFVRQGQHWLLLNELSEWDAVLELSSIQCRIAVGDIYDRITFAAETETAEN